MKNGWLGSILFVCVCWFALGAFCLNVSANSIDAKTGDVWASIDRGADLLPRVERIVKAEMSDRSEIISQITQARQNLSTQIAQHNEDSSKGDLTEAIQANESLKVILESNQFPSGIRELQEQLITETEGSYNRIFYARKQLINEQAGYNSTRDLFFLNKPFTKKMEVLGANSDPKIKLPETQF